MSDNTANKPVPGTKEPSPAQLADGWDFEQFSRNIFTSLVAATQISNKLPAEQYLEYYKTTYPAVKEAMERFTGELRDLTKQVGTQNERPNVSSAAQAGLNNENNELQFNEDVVEVLDDIYENVVSYSVTFKYTYSAFACTYCQSRKDWYFSKIGTKKNMKKVTNFGTKEIYFVIYCTVFVTYRIWWHKKKSFPQNLVRINLDWVLSL